MDENKVVTDEASFDGDVEPILPDGWQEGDDLIPEGVSEDADLLAADGPSDDELLAQLLAEDSPAPAAPTTGGEGQTADQNAGAPEASAQTDGPVPTAPSTSRKLTLKVNHQEQEVDVSKMSDDDLRALLQKGYAFDAMKEAEDRREYLRVYQEQLDAGMTEVVARLVAKEAAGGKTYVVKDGAIEAPPEVEVPAPAPVTPPANMRTTPPPGTVTRDLRAEVEQLRMLYPDVKEIPNEVAAAVSKGIPLTTAYLAYQARESKTAAANLRKENKTLRQNAANMQRAPVKGVTGGDTGQQKSDLFSEGFDAGWNWS